MPERMNQLKERFKNDSNIEIQTDFSSNNTVFEADLMITDWSGTATEFSFITLRPCIFINTPPKINNPDYEKITVPPLEFTLRDEVGIRVKPDDLDGLAEKIRSLLEDEGFRNRIAGIRDRYIAHFGRSGEIGGQYILDLIKKQIAARRQE